LYIHDIVIPDTECCILLRLDTSVATVGWTIKTGRQRSRLDVVGCQRKSVPTRDSGSGSLRVGSDLGPRHAADLPAHRVAQRRNLAVVTVSCCPEGVGVLRALNEVLATLSPDVLASLRADTWLSHYPRLKRPHYHEFAPLLRNGTSGVGGFRRAFGTANYFADATAELPELRVYCHAA
jgi:hypothetical protein